MSFQIKKIPFVTGVLLSASGLLANLDNACSQEDQKEPQRKAGSLEFADENSDGELTTDELKKFLTGRYLDPWTEKMDGNQDGKISKWEFRTIRKALDQVFEDENKAAIDAKMASRKRKPVSSVDQMNAMFLNQEPALGSTIDSLVAFDETGKEVDFKDLRGKHVVLVFGCLT